MRGLAVGALGALLAACAVGPDYVRPELPQVEGFIRDELPATSAENEVEFWRAFGDPLLERLVAAALLHNHDLRIAYANYSRADLLRRDSRYDLFPVLDVGAEAANARASADQMPDATRAGRDYDQYQGSIRAIWELDFFGRIRRTVEAQRAETEASAADLAAMQVLVTGELVRTYFQLRGVQEQLGIAEKNAEYQSRSLELLEIRERGGMGTPFDVDRGRAQLQSTLSRIPALQAEMAVTTHRISVLSGKLPGELAGELEKRADLPVLPASIALDAPSELLRRRPDVAAAERRLAAATARIGVATADLFPRFTLGGLIGTQALAVGALFERDSETRLLSLGVDGGFLNVGRVRARIRAAEAASAADLARYERTVLNALEETENALARVSHSSREATHLQDAAAAAERAAGMARSRFDHGAIDVLELLEAQRTSLQAEDAYTQARVRNSLAVIALYQALAGGWPGHVPEGERLDRVS